MSTRFTNAKLSPSPSIVIRSIEVREFAWLRPDTPLTPVYHYRTVYGEGGAVRRDVLSAESLLHQIIRTFDGQVEQIGEKIYAYFNDPEQAQSCAQAIELHQSRDVDINDTRLMITL
jgi:hypothetical protein